MIASDIGRARAALGIATLALGLSVAGCGEKTAPESREAASRPESAGSRPILDLVPSIEPFRRAFNSSADERRLVAIVSPT